MSANDPRVEFRPGRELREKLERFREELGEKAARPFSMSEVVTAILEEFFERSPKK